MPATRRDLDFRTLDQFEADVVNLQANGYEQTGNWNLGQMAEHLYKVITFSLATDAPIKLPFIVRLLGRWIMKPKVLKSRRFPDGRTAPGPLAPKDNPDEARSVKRLRSAIDRIRTHEGNFPKHPILGNMSNEDWVQFQLIHAAHHLSFLVPKAPTPTPESGDS